VIRERSGADAAADTTQRGTVGAVTEAGHSTAQHSTAQHSTSDSGLNGAGLSLLRDGALAKTVPLSRLPTTFYTFVVSI
jgi:hypothetical protein